MSGIEYHDFPFYEVAEKAGELVRAGADVYQKFTCQQCGNRLTMDVPNKFYKEGTCDNCGAITNIEKQGCNYLIHFGKGTTRDRKER
jgi:rRNA maturation protein Nop10